MGDPAVNRREVLKFGAAVGVVGAFGVTGATAQLQTPPGDVGWLLRVDIPDLPCVSAAIRAVEIEPLVVDPTRIPPGQDLDFRLYGPGAAHWGQAKFTSACTLGASKELQTWFNEAAKGKNIRKNITVTLFKSDKSPGRSYLLYDCFPTQWSSVNFDTSSTVQTETLRVKLGRVEFKT